MIKGNPKWWQNCVVLAAAGLLFVGTTYIGSYFVLADTSIDFMSAKTRFYKYDALCSAFSLAGWAEAKIRREVILVDGPTEGFYYFPDGDSLSLEQIPPSTPWTFPPDYFPN